MSPTGWPEPMSVETANTFCPPTVKTVNSEEITLLFCMLIFRILSTSVGNAVTGEAAAGVVIPVVLQLEDIAPSDVICKVVPAPHEVFPTYSATFAAGKTVYGYVGAGTGEPTLATPLRQPVKVSDSVPPSVLS